MRPIIAFIATLFWAAPGFALWAGLSFALWAEPGFAQSSFVNWENPHVHPIEITPGGGTLLAVNTADNRLEVFDIATGGARLVGSIPVGLDPVSVRARTDTEAWVVNHISDSVSVVNLATGNVVKTIHTEDEPADVVFAGAPQRAFVSCSQANSVLVFDPSGLGSPVARIAIEGEDPRAMAVNDTGTEVYVAVFESGNNTTLLGGGLTMLGDAFPPNVVSDPLGPYGGDNPPPNNGDGFTPAKNPATPPPPEVGLIVKNVGGMWHDDNGADWTRLVSGDLAARSGRRTGWHLHDHDLAIIDTTDLSVSYATGLMNLCMAVGFNPGTGQVAVVGTNATNEIRFEPILQGKFIRVNVAVVDPAAPESSAVSDLNPHLDYVASQIPQDERDLSLGDPRGIVWRSDGEVGYVSGMGSNNIVVIDGDGKRVGGKSAIEVGEGPTGLALDEPRGRLYVMNKFEGTISVINAQTETEIDRVPFFDPTPSAVKIGRKHLYDTHKNSGLGHIACGSCHIDSRMDRLAWDLGDPAGAMKSFNQNCLTELAADCEDWHPMKGPMTTQTLQDIIGKEPLHWRADRDGIEEFNGAFIGLQGDDENLNGREMQEFEDFLSSIHFPPNPFRNLDNSLPQSLPLPGHFTTGRFGPAGRPLPNGNAVAGLAAYREDGLDAPFECVTCHTLPTGLGTDMEVASLFPPRLSAIPPGPNGERHAGVVSLDGSTNTSIKVPQLRNLYEKVGFEMTQLSNGAGFGFLHDGSIDSIARFVAEPAFELNSDQGVADLVAFMLAFSGSDLPQGSANNLLEPPGLASQDTHAAVGTQLTVGASNRDAVETITRLADLIALADSGAVGVVARGRRDGERRGYVYAGNGLFESDRAGETISSAALRLQSDAGAEMTFTAVPKGTEVRIGVDRDEDGFFDADELDACSDPTNPQVTPATSSCDGQFARGSCNGDKQIDVSDSVFLLLWLFRDGTTPPCADACDINDDGKLNLADPVAELGFLFRGDKAPEAPFGACGSDPTDDALGCDVFTHCPSSE